MKTLLLYVGTAIAEIVGCYLPLLWLRGQGSGWWLLPAAAVSLATFAWLLTLHAAPSGRVYAAYGGVYVAVALGWLWSVDGVRPSSWDLAGVAVTLAGHGDHCVPTMNMKPDNVVTINEVYGSTPYPASASETL